MHHGGETNEHRGQMKGKTEFHGGDIRTTWPKQTEKLNLKGGDKRT